MVRTLTTLLLLMMTTLAGCEFKTFDHERAEINHLRLIGILAANYKSAHTKYPVDMKELEKNLGGETLADEWGTKVKYEVIEDGYVVTSAGVDKIHGTTDDLRLTSADIEN